MADPHLQPTPGTASPATQAERRHVTVLFCDLVDSTALSSRLDPEDMRDLNRQYQAACAGPLQRHGGYIARYMGDGILAYFGYPVAHEDGASRALCAGLEIIQAVANLQVPGAGALRVRVGAAAGLVVVGDLIGSGKAAEIGVSGLVPNLAARVMSLAEPNAMLVSDDTWKLTRTGFRFADHGMHQLKGVPHEVRVWKVLSEPTEQTRYEAKSESLFVGRDEQLDALHGLWEEAGRCRGRIAIVRGEAGIGKSALLRRFEADVRGQPFTRILLQCSGRHADSPLYPLITHLRRTANIEPSDTAERKLEKIRVVLAPALVAGGAPLIAALLSPASQLAQAPLAAVAAMQKRATLELIVENTLLLAERQPVLLLVEDAHWIDPTSAELADLLVSRVAGARLLVVVTARPEYDPAWAGAPEVQHLALPPLTPANLMVLVRHLASREDLSDWVVERIVERSEGIPLFAEELTKTMTEARADGAALRQLEEERIPETLQDSLVARLDRLGEDKQPAQIAAVLGRRFTLPMLGAVAYQREEELAVTLERLTASGLLVTRGEGASREYVFRHALMQEAAYELLLRSQRREFHWRVAQALEQQFGPAMETEPETVAHHWTRADRPAAAAPWWLKAAQRAIAQAANVEAVRHAREGLAVLGKLPASPERDKLEFALCLALGQGCYVVDGPGAPSTGAAYTRAQELLAAAGDAEQRYTVLYGIFSSYHFASRFELAREPAMRALQLATAEGDTMHLCQAHRMLGYISFFTGDTAAADLHFRTLESLYVPEEHGKLAARYGADCRVGSMGFHSLIVCVRGQCERAIEMAAANLRYAQALGHPASIGWAYAASGYLWYYLHDPVQARAITGEGIRFCTENNVASWLAHCRAFNAWAEGCLSPSPQGASALRQVLAAAAAGNALGLPLLRTLLSDVLRAGSHDDEALDVVEKGLAEMELTGQRFFEPSLHLARGRCILALRGAQEAAAASFAQAQASAHRMGAALLEQEAIDLLAHMGGEQACGLPPEVRGAL